MKEKICDIWLNVAKHSPLIHCITNPISINSCANAILALGARPVMAEHPAEVCEITESADALMLNIANITDARMESIILSIAKAKEKNIPVLLDIVGIACSKLRREYVFKLLNSNMPSVIKGNFSEIAALYDVEYFSPGVDADPSVDKTFITKVATELAKKHNTVILASGKVDVVTDGTRTFYIKNGTPQLASVTGTGCMLGSICTTFMATASPLDAAVAACCYLGISGELAITDKGNGSFMVNLMDRISTLSKFDISKHLNLEEI